MSENKTRTLSDTFKKAVPMQLVTMGMQMHQANLPIANLLPVCADGLLLHLKITIFFIYF